MEDRTIDVLGLHVHDLSRKQLLDRLAAWSDPSSDVPHRMFYTNAHVFNLAVEDPKFAGVLKTADVLIFEGFGGCLGAQVLGHARPEQLATMDWIDDFLVRLAARQGSVYLLGDEPGVAARCGERMATRHQGLRVVGTHHGFFDHDGPGNEEVLADVARARPDVLMVGMGNPRQERWIDHHVASLGVPLTMALGAMFRWYVDEEPRAPAWMRHFHLEWLLRLLRHPIRYFRRYVLGNPTFILRVLRQRTRPAGRT